MKLVNIVDEKINKLKETLKKFENSNLSQLERTKAELSLINQCESILLDENLISQYDFTDIINLLDSLNLSNDNLKNNFLQFQQVIVVRKVANLDSSMLPFTPEQEEARKNLESGIASAKENILDKLKELEEQQKNKPKDENIENLEELKNLLNGTSKKKYYTDEMVDSFFEDVDFDNLSLDVFDDMIDGFYSCKNLKGSQLDKNENITDVINLYMEFLDDSTGLFKKLLTKYKDEICSFIDLDNTREILQFFKDSNILDRFNRNALLKVSLFGNVDYVKKIYNNILKNHFKEIDLYFEDVSATLWVCDSSNERRSSFGVLRDGNDNSFESSLYSQCHSVTEEEFWENVDCLNKNCNLFNDKYDLSNLGAHLKTKTIFSDILKKTLKLITMTSWSLKKNISLFKKFGLGGYYKIPVSSLEYGDLENKIHLAIELGLLNPPMDVISLEQEKNIETSSNFNKIPKHSSLANNSIRNYFIRNLSVLASTNVNDYAFYTYKLDTLGFVGFYNYFFSEKSTGNRDYNYILDDMNANFTDKEAFIKENFVNKDFDVKINNYKIYDYNISNYDEDEKTNRGFDEDYFDKDILNNELIIKLEKENRVIDSLKRGEDIVKIPNEFVYKFGDKLISRYKVLRNASILFKKYGYLDEDMLLTSIVRNSFISDDAFNEISYSVKERGKTI